MNVEKTQSTSGAALLLKAGVDLSDIKVSELAPDTPLTDYQAAIELAELEAKKQLGEAMLISWYDRDRDFESPQHSSECHLDSAIPGYVDYGLSHGAKLMIDIEQGRFILFYMPVDM